MAYSAPPQQIPTTAPAQTAETARPQHRTEIHRPAALRTGIAAVAGVGVGLVAELAAYLLIIFAGIWYAGGLYGSLSPTAEAVSTALVLVITPTSGGLVAYATARKISGRHARAPKLARASVLLITALYVATFNRDLVLSLLDAVFDRTLGS